MIHVRRRLLLVAAILLLVAAAGVGGLLRIGRRAPPSPGTPLVEESSAGAPYLAGRRQAVDAEDPKSDGTAGDAAEAQRTLVVCVRARVDERPVRGASVSLFDHDGGLVATAVTDEEGQIRLLVDRGSQVEARAPGFGRSVVRVSVRAGEEREVSIDLPPARTFAGRVVDARDGRPIEGASVRVLDLRPIWGFTGGDARWDVLRAGGSVRSDAQGRFAFEGESVAPFRDSPGVTGQQQGLEVRAPGHATRRVLVPDATLLVSEEGLEVALAPAGRACGVVLYPDGRPVADAGVLFTSWSGPHAAVGRWSLLPSVVTGDETWTSLDVFPPPVVDLQGALEVRANEAGRFAADDLPPSWGGLFARARTLDGRSSDPVAVGAPKDGEPAPVTLRLVAATPLEVHVVAEDGRPVPGLGVTVEVSASGWLSGADEVRFTATTDADGVARLASITPGWVRATADVPPGTAGRTSGTRVGAGQSGRVDLVLRGEAAHPGTSAPPHVPGEDGKVLLRLRVRVPAGVEPPRHVSLESGTWGSFGGSWTQVAAGVWEAEVRVPGGGDHVVLDAGPYRPVRWDVRLEPGATIDLPERMLDPGFVVEGRVLDAWGRPLNQALVEAFPEAEGDELLDLFDSPYFAQTGEDGRFRIPALPPGPTRFTARSVWSERKARVEAVVAKDMAPVEIRFPPMARVVGRVVDGSGDPLGGLYAVLEQPRSGTPDEVRSIRQIPTDVAGRFQLAVPGGAYRLAIRRDWADEATELTRRELDLTDGETTQVTLVAAP